MFETLPPELVSVIGTHLDIKDRLSCFLACKGFESISWKNEYQTIKLTPENLLCKIHNVKKITSAFKKFKKHLKLLDIICSIDNSHVGNIAPFDADAFDGIKHVELFIKYENGPVDRVLDLFRNISFDKVHFDIENRWDPQFFRNLKTNVSMKIMMTRGFFSLDLRELPDNIKPIQLIVCENYNEVNILGIDKVDVLYLTAVSKTVLDSVRRCVLKHNCLPRLREIGYTPILAEDFPIENSFLVKVLQRSPNAKVDIFLSDSHVYDPSIVSYVRYFSKNNDILVKYYTKDLCVLAHVLNKTIGVKIAHFRMYKPSIELLKLVNTTSNLNTLFKCERAKNIWWFL